jgi:predicted Zn-dependent protease
VLPALVALAVGNPLVALAPARAAAEAAPPADVDASIGSAPGALPSLGDAAAQDLSPMQERKLGDQIMRSLLSDPDVVDDPLVLEYVSQVWGRLLDAAKRLGEIGPDLEASHAWRPFLVKDPTVNAFALPGGYIGIHFGLLAMTTTPDELASVMAHELSHVTQRHIARMMSRQSRQSMVSLASLILGILAASRAPAAAEAMIYGGQAGAIQDQLNFSRDMEREADRVGFGVLKEAGFQPEGMALMFEHLQQASRLNDDGSWPFLRTHPLTTQRIAEAHARVGPGAWDDASQRSRTDTALYARHVLMSARSRVLMDTRGDALAVLSSPDIKRGAGPLLQLSAHYMAAVAQWRSARPQQALDELTRARSLQKELPLAQQAVVARVLDLTQVDVDLALHQPRAAAEALAQAPAADGLGANARPEMLLRAQIALAAPEGSAQAAEWREAAARLQTHLSVHPEDATAWSTLAQLWQRLKQPIRAVRADAEAVAANGDLAGAIDRVEGARKRFRQPSADDVIELSVMDARMKTWQRQQREDMKDR